MLCQLADLIIKIGFGLLMFIRYLLQMSVGDLEFVIYTLDMLRQLVTLPLKMIAFLSYLL